MPIFSLSFFLFCWVLVFGYLISWIEMLIFVTFLFCIFYFGYIIEWRRIRSFLLGCVFFFCSSIVFIQANFVIKTVIFGRQNDFADGIEKRKNEINKHNHTIYEWLNGLWMRVKNIHRISNVRKLSISDVDQHTHALTKKKPYRKSVRENTTQLIIIIFPVKFIKKYAHTKPPIHSMFPEMPIEKKENWFQI